MGDRRDNVLHMPNSMQQRIPAVGRKACEKAMAKKEYCELSIVI